jgi:peptide/nickel transport system permease protein
MRYWLRRVLWLVPTLAVATLLAFVGVGGQDSALDEEPRLPLLFNPDPVDVRRLALGAVERIAASPNRDPAAEHALVRLGGAALPHVLSRMDQLTPEARGRVAVALAPVGRRMQVGTEDELYQRDQAVLFWSRFWEDRALDFRPAMAKRLARRLAERASVTRRDEVLVLDTFALPALLGELGGMQVPRDTARVSRLVAILSHITGREAKLDDERDSAQAKALAAAWQSWWSRHRHQYVPLDGVRRIEAMWLQTRYGQWAAETLRTFLTGPQGSKPWLERLARSGPMTLWLLGATLTGGWLGGVLMGLVSLAYPRSLSERGLVLVMPALGSIPAATAAMLLVPGSTPAWTAWWAAWIAAAVVACTVAWYVRTVARAVRVEEYQRTHVAYGLPPWRLAWLGARQTGLLALSLVAVHLPEVWSAVLLVEQALGLPGLGQDTVAAVGDRDVGWLMLVSVLSVTSVWLAQSLGDRLLARLDPRLGGVLGSRLGEQPA